ncbi:conserved hypothetical protein [Deferribacter desulfuricans SSM1]|uniref:Glycine zipper domain-containing protein n=1 Tax=Deferribacter desulfuricans (strain DSM 14783 / JCM 11476 / NBRC 101012 / SSM1) TaxID=639282 RepID=D3P8R2_DEFDS|nr:hypothetical protein [Deferribacter desulfuricans]BAI81102.1 conserved hypothetical protein [Deferribacter desulfuricans SSM1]
MKKVALVVAILFVFSTFSVVKAETRGGVILQDTFYGALTGTIIGAALLAFKEDPGDHLEYITYGAAAGAIVGAVYGVYEATALVEIDNNKVKVAMPTIITEKKGDSLSATANLIKVRY